MFEIKIGYPKNFEPGSGSWVRTWDSDGGDKTQLEGYRGEFTISRGGHSASRNQGDGVRSIVVHLNRLGAEVIAGGKWYEEYVAISNAHSRKLDWTNHEHRRLAADGEWRAWDAAGDKKLERLCRRIVGEALRKHPDMLWKLIEDAEARGYRKGKAFVQSQMREALGIDGNRYGDLFVNAP